MILKLSEDHSFLDIEGVPVSKEVNTLEEFDAHIKSFKAAVTLMAQDYGYEICHPYDI